MSKQNRSPKVRMWQIDCLLTGTTYRIEVKKWYGWVIYSNRHNLVSKDFFTKEEADKHFEYLSKNGNGCSKKLIAWTI